MGGGPGPNIYITSNDGVYIQNISLFGCYGEGPGGGNWNGYNYFGITLYNRVDDILFQINLNPGSYFLNFALNQYIYSIWGNCTLFPGQSIINSDNNINCSTGQSGDGCDLIQYPFVIDDLGIIEFESNNSPSPYGLYDMAGNVSEWLEKESGDEIETKIKGGSWYDNNIQVWSSSFIWRSNPYVDGGHNGDLICYFCKLTFHYRLTGFRCVRQLNN